MTSLPAQVEGGEHGTGICTLQRDPVRLNQVQALARQMLEHTFAKFSFARF